MRAGSAESAHSASAFDSKSTNPGRGGMPDRGGDATAQWAAHTQESDLGLTIEGALASASGVWIAKAGVVPFARILRLRSLPMFLRRR